ncbi:hypothetical protein QDZ74_001818 [Pluralibacter gergoviae]|uniref:hypothetical protein n=1 Tax=Pluralibacter gergoviae TaxID=61647 RepID=UPI001113F8F5|nr:hypothetical protein [Pluralibacter gergoviae]EKW6618222.1 hypothetical protein [Pluralibacter gergoviae]
MFRHFYFLYYDAILKQWNVSQYCTGKGISLKLSHRDALISSLIDHAHSISSLPEINEMILIHEKLLSDFYAKKPLFYKMLFKSFRFYIASAAFSIYYCQPSASLKFTKEFIAAQEKSISINTLNSLFTLLMVSGRLIVYRSEENARDMLFRPSESVQQEISDLIRSMLIPWRTYYSSSGSRYRCHAKNFLPQFFSRYGDFVFHHITIKGILPESELFIERDGGHMIMLILYKEYILQGTRRIILSSKKIASYSHVSRSHICSLLREAQNAGFIHVENNLFIELSDKFINMFRTYFSLYLAQVLYAFNVEPENIRRR